jgi:hypothetical protein
VGVEEEVTFFKNCYCHSREGRNPVLFWIFWIPVFIHQSPLADLLPELIEKLRKFDLAHGKYSKI